MVIYGIAGSIPLFLVWLGLIQLLKLFEAKKPFSVVCLIVYPILITTMILMASFILYQTKPTSPRTSTSDVVNYRKLNALAEFHKQVAAVALVFCSCQSLSLVRNGLLALHPRGAQIVHEYGLDTGNAFLNIFNSSVNIFIYLSISRNFRRAFIRFWSRLSRS